jgi:hypothetical protein
MGAHPRVSGIEYKYAESEGRVKFCGALQVFSAADALLIQTGHMTDNKRLSYGRSRTSAIRGEHMSIPSEL